MSLRGQSQSKLRSPITSLSKRELEHFYKTIFQWKNSLATAIAAGEFLMEKPSPEVGYTEYDTTFETYD